MSPRQLFSLFLLPALLLGCSDQRVQKLEGYTQGTTYHISYWSETPVDSKALKTGIDRELAHIDQILSNYRSDSVIETFNHTESTESQDVGNEIVSLVRVAQHVHQASQGCYDLTIKPLFELWGFKADTLNIPTAAAIQSNLQQTGMDKLEVVDDSHLRKKQADLQIDVSSIAQGYSVEKISQLMEQNQISNYLVEIGGELKTNGHKPDAGAWRIAVERPLPGEQTMQKIITTPKDSPLAIMTSGTYRHYFDDQGQRYSHILDARTGQPVTHNLVSTTVLHENPVVADAWSTALLCLGQQDGMKAANAEKIAVLFIQQQGDQLIESKSDALSASTNLTIQ
ncbi:MAG: FAD:protein FMN transferase [Gammaproteobacteria bacterium]